MFSFSFPVSDLDRFELHLSCVENHESLSLSPRNDPDAANKTTPLVASGQSIHVQSFQEANGQKAWRIFLGPSSDKSSEGVADLKPGSSSTVDLTSDMVQSLQTAQRPQASSEFASQDNTHNPIDWQWAMGTPEQSHLLTPPFCEDLLTGKSVCTENNPADGYDWARPPMDWTSCLYHVDAQASPPSLPSFEGSPRFKCVPGIPMSSVNQSLGQTGPSLDSPPISEVIISGADNDILQATRDTQRFPSSSYASSSPGGDSPASGASDSQGDTKDVQNRKYPCSHPGCNRRFLREYTRKVHEMTHIPKEQHPFLCSNPNCDTRFSRQHDRLRHQVIKHGQESPWTCESCGKFFSAAKNLDRHTCAATPLQRHHEFK